MSFPSLVNCYLLDLDESSTCEKDVAAMPLTILFVLFTGFLIWLYLSESQHPKLHHAQYVPHISKEILPKLAKNQYVQTGYYPPKKILKVSKQNNEAIPKHSEARTASTSNLARLLQEHAPANPLKSTNSNHQPPPTLSVPSVQEAKIASFSVRPFKQDTSVQNPEIKPVTVNTISRKKSIIDDSVINNQQHEHKQTRTFPDSIEYSETSWEGINPPSPIIPPVSKSFFGYLHLDKKPSEKNKPSTEPIAKHKIAFDSSIDQIEPRARLQRNPTGYVHNVSLSDTSSSNELFLHDVLSSDRLSPNSSNAIISRPSKDVEEESLADHRSQKYIPTESKKNKGRTKNTKK